MPGRVDALGPGDLDRSFGIDGATVTRFGPIAESGGSATSARDLVVLEDGGLLVAGTAPDADGRRAFALARYRANGRPDRSFGDRGIVVRQLGSESSGARALVAEPGGGAVVVGSAVSADGEAVALARFDERGRLLWGTTDQVGTGAVPFSAGLDIARQTDGRLVVAGRASAGSPDGPDPFVARYVTTNGARDQSFAAGGVLVEPAPRADQEDGCRFGAAEASAVVVSATGQIHTAGSLARTCPEGESPRALLHSYSPAGVRDPAYGTGALGLTTVGALVAGPKGTLLAGGTLGDRAGLARYTPAGEPDGPPGDEFFPRDGYGTVADATPSAVTGLARLQSERIVAAIDGPSDADSVVRREADGTADESFATGGLAGARLRSPAALALTAGGDVVVAGDRITVGPGDPQVFVLARLHGGTDASRVRIGGRARLRRGAARVKVRCVGGPGCEGVITGPRVGQVAYAVAPGEREVFEVPVVAGARRARTTRLKVTNAPADPVRRSVALR